MLKIQSGKYRGRTIFSDPTQNMRPTLSKSRSAILNVLNSNIYIDEYEVVDLFAGSGALGFETLSRGAKFIHFVELDKVNFRQVEKSVAALGVKADCKVYNQDALFWLKNMSLSESNKIFYLDPPYKTNLVDDAIKIIAEKSEKLDGSILIIETEKEKEFSYPDFLKLFQQKTYGKTRIDFLQIGGE